MIKRHLKKSQEHPNGTIAEREGSIHVSNLQLKTRFDGSKRRVAKAPSDRLMPDGRWKVLARKALPPHRRRFFSLILSSLRHRLGNPGPSP
jgi:ribosomal protein L24